jgi:hypothetical protein
MILTQAFRNQCTIGWEQFLRGRISILWGKAFSLTQDRKNTTKISSKKWASDLITLLLAYTSSLWKFRNGVVQGHNLEEEEKKKRESLHTSITNAYAAYNADKFIVGRQLSSLFDKPIEYILKSDIDYLQCWLNTYEEATKMQQVFRRRQSIAAKNFFKPRNTNNLHNSTKTPKRQIEPLTATPDSQPDDSISLISLATTISYSTSQDTSHSSTTDYLENGLSSVDSSTDIDQSLSCSDDEVSLTDSVFKPILT